MLEVWIDNLLSKRHVLWLLRRDLKETESEMIAAQDQALQTKYHMRKILQTNRKQWQAL